MKRYFVLTIIAVFFLFVNGSPGFAATPALGDTCANNGEMSLTPTNGVLWVLTCTSGTWKMASIGVGDGSGGCTNSNEGALSYDSSGKSWSFCNGSSFVPFNSAAGIAKIKTSTASAAFPSTATCTAPSCDAGYISKGCQKGEADALLSDLALTNSAYASMVTNMVNTGYSTSACTASRVAALVTLTARVICSRLCISNS